MRVLIARSQMEIRKQTRQLNLLYLILDFIRTRAQCTCGNHVLNEIILSKINKQRDCMCLYLRARHHQNRTFYINLLIF